MATADEHLEEALSEYNDRVNVLEGRGASQELLDAYLNRGSVLAMMDSYVSAITDFDDAIELIKVLENSGRTVDAGCYVKGYVGRGELHGEDGEREMAMDYSMAALRLGELKDGSRYYDRCSTVEMCLDCAGDLVDADFAKDANPFTDRALAMLVGHDDVWSRNRYVEACNLAGQAEMDQQQNAAALESFSEAIRVGQVLQVKHQLEDEIELAYAYVSRGDLDDDMQQTKEYFADRLAAISLLEDLMKRNALDDTELLANLHGEVAEAYMRANNMKEAERHLMRQVAINLDGARDYMRDNHIDDGSDHDNDDSSPDLEGGERDTDDDDRA